MEKLILGSKGISFTRISANNAIFLPLTKIEFCFNCNFAVSFCVQFFEAVFVNCLSRVQFYLICYDLRNNIEQRQLFPKHWTCKVVTAGSFRFFLQVAWPKVGFDVKSERKRLFTKYKTKITHNKASECFW